MSPYFHARWYVDASGVLQRRTAVEQQRVEELLLDRRETAALAPVPHDADGGERR